MKKHIISYDPASGSSVEYDFEDIELKPCPWCGEINKYDNDSIFVTNSGTKWGAVQCAGCGCQSPEIRTGYEKLPKWKDAAVKEWNTRSG